MLPHSETCWRRTSLWIQETFYTIMTGGDSTISKWVIEIHVCMILEAKKTPKQAQTCVWYLSVRAVYGKLFFYITWSVMYCIKHWTALEYTAWHLNRSTGFQTMCICALLKGKFSLNITHMSPLTVMIWT